MELNAQNKCVDNSIWVLKAIGILHWPDLVTIGQYFKMLPKILYSGGPLKSIIAIVLIFLLSSLRFSAYPKHSVYINMTFKGVPWPPSATDFYLGIEGFKPYLIPSSVLKSA